MSVLRLKSRIAERRNDDPKPARLKDTAMEASPEKKAGLEIGCCRV